MAIATRTSVTEAIAEFATGRHPKASDEVYERITRAFIDTIGVAIAGRNEACFTISPTRSARVTLRRPCFLRLRETANVRDVFR